VTSSLPEISITVSSLSLSISNINISLYNILESKLDTKKNLNEALSELCEMTNCNNCIFFEVRKHTDLYMWMGKMPNGPSVKFFVQNGKVT
jgi:hypothetical protein